MKPRMNFYQAAPDTIKALNALETHIQSTGLEKSLIELVKIRASQINGCAFCINMHTEDARKRGESEQRIYLLNAWRESPLYTDRERAALAWTESVTLIAETHAPRRRLRAGPRAVLRGGDGEPDHADRDHQCLEQAGDLVPGDSPGEGKGTGVRGVDRRKEGNAATTLATVMPRESGASSIPETARIRTTAAAYWIARPSRTMTAEYAVTLSHLSSSATPASQTAVAFANST
ncbi:AhpD family alkylhydroperoxidase [Bradyrhizobium sp. LM2.7]